MSYRLVYIKLLRDCRNAFNSLLHILLIYIIPVAKNQEFDFLFLQVIFFSDEEMEQITFSYQLIAHTVLYHQH
jgi:hypothetical protein